MNYFKQVILIVSACFAFFFTLIYLTPHVAGWILSFIPIKVIQQIPMFDVIVFIIIILIIIGTSAVFTSILVSLIKKLF